MIWRLIKDFKFNIVFSACFDYDIDVFSLYICVCILHAPICRKFITNVPHVHNIVSQRMGDVYF